MVTFENACRNSGVLDPGPRQAASIAQQAELENDYLRAHPDYPLYSGVPEGRSPFEFIALADGRLVGREGHP